MGKIVKKTLHIDDDAVTNAASWYLTKYGEAPSSEEFEKEFHCKINYREIIFSPRDYTYFLLKWSGKK